MGELIDADPELVTELDISHLLTEDDTPVDNFQSEEQQRLLVEPLYSSAALPAPFLAAANVGLFYRLHGDPIVPDVMLSLGVQRAPDFGQRRYRSYFVWEQSKPPKQSNSLPRSDSEPSKLSSSWSRNASGPIVSRSFCANRGWIQILWLELQNLIYRCTQRVIPPG